MKTATWVWDSHYPFTNQLSFYDFLQDKEVDRVYLQLDTSISLAEYSYLSKMLHSLGVQLYALNGDPTWVTNPLTYTSFTNYLQGQNGIFQGIHLDVEPYSLPVWNTDQSGTITKFENMINNFTSFCQKNTYRFEMDIPFWYTTDLLTFILSHVDEVAIMAYRNFASGGNGLVDISTNIINLADQLNKKVLIGVETQSLPENYTSFYNSGETAMIGQLDQVRQVFQSHRSFHGFAIHDLKNWMLLKL